MLILTRCCLAESQVPIAGPRVAERTTNQDDTSSFAAVLACLLVANECVLRFAIGLLAHRLVVFSGNLRLCTSICVASRLASFLGSRFLSCSLLRRIGSVISPIGVLSCVPSSCHAPLVLPSLLRQMKLFSAFSSRDVCHRIGYDVSRFPSLPYLANSSST